MNLENVITIESGEDSLSEPPATASVIEISSTTDLDDGPGCSYTRKKRKKGGSRQLLSNAVSSDSEFSTPKKKRKRKPFSRKRSLLSRSCGVSSDSEVNSPMKPIISSSDSNCEQLPHKRKCTRNISFSDSEVASPQKRLSSTSVSSSELSDDSDVRSKFYNNNPNLPVYQYTSHRYNAETIAEVLLNPELTKVATSRPVCIQDNATFVVDLSKLRKKEDIRADDLGSWHCNGKRFVKCEVDGNGKVVELFTKPRSHRGTNLYTVIRRYYEHTASRDFKKTIAEVLDPSGNQLSFALVQYVFCGSPHPIISKPHGNSKELKPFVRTAPSTLQNLKARSKTDNAKRVIFSVTEERGGVTNSEAVGDLPRNRKQVYNIQARENSKTEDALLSVMAMCKQSYSGDSDPYVRIVTSAPEPMCVLSTTSQLFDIKRFCTGSDEFCPLTIDPTFDLGDFSVTVTCYRHLLLQSRQNKSKSPVMIGPMLVHRRKEYSSYHFFASSLVSLNPALSHLHAFGTDGEEALYQAFSKQFQEAVHLRCFLHFRDNCKAKLHEIGVSNNVLHEILQDIFGCVVKGKEGLVDSACSNELHTSLQSLKEKWDSLAFGFFDWFIQYKAQSIEDSMIRPIRISGGLGDPPEPYYTNDIESINRVIKRKTNYKACEWPEFCRVAHELVKEQDSEVEKAVIGVGEFCFKDKYKHLEIPLHKWSSMSAVQRERHLKKVASAELHYLHAEKLTPSVGASEKPGCSSTTLSLKGIGFDTKGMQLPFDVLSSMFLKADRLVSGANCIVPAPGAPTAKLVESKSGHRPHFVTRKGSHKYCCDADCPMWKCSQVCAHTIAVAFTDTKLQEFLSSCCSRPSLYALAKSNTKTKAGKKPARRKASSKSSSRAIAQFQHERSSTSMLAAATVAPSSSGTSAPQIELLQTPHINVCSADSGLLTSECQKISLVQSPCIKSASQSVHMVQSPSISVSASSHGISMVQSPHITTIVHTQPQSLNVSATSRVRSSPLATALQSCPSSSLVKEHSDSSGHTTTAVGQNVHPAVVNQVSSSQTSCSRTPSVVNHASTSVSQTAVGQHTSTSSSVGMGRQAHAASSCSTMVGQHAGGLSSSVLSQHTQLPGQSIESNVVSTLARLLQQVVSSGTEVLPSSQSVLVQPSPQIEPNNLFWVTFLVGNISRCQGCGGRIEKGSDGKVLPPPDDLVIQHKEQVLFRNPHSGVYQLSRDYRNVYYHAKRQCIQRKFVSFEAAKHIRASNQIFSRLSGVHKEFIKKEFAIQFSSSNL